MITHTPRPLSFLSLIVYTSNFLLSFWDAVHTMFWALFDQTDLEHFNTPGERFGITQETGKFLFGMFSICAVMVGINMLVAMMNNSYLHIAVSAYNKRSVLRRQCSDIQIEI